MTFVWRHVKNVRLHALTHWHRLCLRHFASSHFSLRVVRMEFLRADVIDNFLQSSPGCFEGTSKTQSTQAPVVRLIASLVPRDKVRNRLALHSALLQRSPAFC